MDNCNAPQWADFSCSPSSDSYFEVEHEVHNFQRDFKLPLPLCKQQNIEDLLVTETSFEDSLESAEGAQTNVAFFIPHDSKNQKETNNEDIKEDKKPPKSNLYCAWDISINGLASTSGATSVPQRLKTAAGRKEIKKSNCVMETKNNAIVRKPQQKAQRRQSDSFKSKQPPRKVLTCQYGRRSLLKYRRRSSKFVSTAEAISKFQNETPERFRTTSKKDSKLGPSLKSKRSPLKLTLPVSPKLRCKQRVRRTNVLSQEEREALEVEEMKKSRIKAHPVPVNIFKGPPALKKVPKKRITVPEKFKITKSKKTCLTIVSGFRAEDCDNEQIRKDTVPTTSSSSSVSSVCENDKVQTGKNTRTMSRSISAASVVKKDSKERNSNNNNNVKPVSCSTSALSIRKDQSSGRGNSKEQNVKPSCSTSASPVRKQEMNKPKSSGFHTKPLPKSPKTSTNSAKEPATKKRTVISCPFSFAERDKQMAKKKEEFVKQMQENDKKVPAFRANPAPAFKPVVVHNVVKDKSWNEKSTDKRTKKRSECR